MVDFPTPPLPEATATICFTPAMGHFLGGLGAAPPVDSIRLARNAMLPADSAH